MSFYHLKFILFAEKTLICKTPIGHLTRVLCGRINSCPAPQRSICLSHGHSGIITGRLVPQEDGVVKRAIRKIKFLMFDKAKLSTVGYFLYESIADRIDYLKFFEEMTMPDTMNSWFLVTELHVWMLMAKAMEYGQSGRVIRNKIVEAMWADVTNKAKKLGPENASAARKQTMELGDQFQAAILTYDEGILSDDRVLAAALWRRFFEKECRSAKSLETMVKYVRQQMEYLDNLSEDDFKKCEIMWLPFDKT